MNPKEKKILKKIKNKEAEEEYKEVTRLYEQLLSSNKDINPEYLLNYALFILENYEEFEVDEWSKLFEGAINTCHKIPLNCPKPIASMLHVYEYRLMIEAIRYEPSYHYKYGDEQLKRTLDDAIVLNPLNAEAYYCRGEFYSANNLGNQAEEDYNTSIQLQNKNNNKLMLYLDKAANNEKIGSNQKALEDYYLALELTDNRNIIMLIYQAFIRIYTKEDNEKLSYYKNLLEELK